MAQGFVGGVAGKPQYDLTKRVEALEARPSSPGKNLLINWYFVGGRSIVQDGQFPVNQRGYSTYTTAGYTIDRWKAGTGTTVYVKVGGISINNGGILTQPFETGRIPDGATVTVSMLVDDELIAATGTWNTSNSSDIAAYGDCGINIYANAKQNLVYIENDGGTTSSLIKAVKIEIGTNQTLAVKSGSTWALNDPPPDYATELLKCQRYYYRVEACDYSNMSRTPYGGYFLAVMTSSNKANLYIPTPTTMRVRPTLNANNPQTCSGSDGTSGGYVDIVGAPLTPIYAGVNCMICKNVTLTFDGDTHGTGTVLIIAPEDTGSYIALDAEI